MPATMVMSPSVIASLSQCERAGWEGRCHPAPKQSGGSQKDCVTSFGRSPREQQRSACRSEDSALFLSADVALFERMAGELDPPIVHLGASSELLTPDLVVALRKSLSKTKFMRSVPVTGPEAVGVAQAYDGVVDWILLDSHRTGDVQIGAQGVTHDWSISRKIVESVRTPVILAGGLGPDNVKEAVRSVRPAVLIRKQEPIKRALTQKTWGR